ncbi:hypothetical protein [Luteimicrobium subarcticum]|uniref:DUF4337 domain-containing protein n=1 Tax=Luteimicrobium subarcticum TaxID=620910 RepID=A0A2M8WS21_9MICO|nr:hypothetical protein [Luteimicrobium subarcticum]PJI93731.1 hypothetical protein CLV34_1205 [Luteimicrobium subarcticum]
MDEQHEDVSVTDAEGRRTRWIETVTVVVLSVTAILTAWSGFEASKWGGAMSIAFSQASSARIEASRDAGAAEALKQIDLSTFTLYVQAVAEKDTQLSDFAEERFTDRFRPAFDEWLAAKPLKNPDAPKTPFELDSYVVPGQKEAAAADARADVLFQVALRNNQRGDNYTILTVLFALVLFFAAFAGRFKTPRIGWTMLVGAVVLLGVGIVFLATFPKLV